MIASLSFGDCAIAISIVFAVIFFLDIVIGSRRDDMGHRVSLKKRLRIWIRQMWDLFLSG